MSFLEWVQNQQSFRCVCGFCPLPPLASAYLLGILRVVAMTISVFTQLWRITHPPLIGGFRLLNHKQSASSALYRWDEDEVNRKLERVMVESFEKVWNIHKERNIPLRTAAFTLALQRVTRAHIHRGFD